MTKEKNWWQEAVRRIIDWGNGISVTETKTEERVIEIDVTLNTIPSYRESPTREVTRTKIDRLETIEFGLHGSMMIFLRYLLIGLVLLGGSASLSFVLYLLFT
ncbi:hypothetical protein KKF05_02725 [Patescibacteria group bacterium]|nr:hypothetical protein [Patescibacteria group bacterium]MBU1029352.1 hypothetical protein [Patescibacteria group bacterium]MBU1916354.1 hypothetical protein [Patescibacteria group bacterium]